MADPRGEGGYIDPGKLDFPGRETAKAGGKALQVAVDQLTNVPETVKIEVQGNRLSIERRYADKDSVRDITANVDKLLGNSGFKLEHSESGFDNDSQLSTPCGLAACPLKGVVGGYPPTRDSVIAVQCRYYGEHRNWYLALVP